MVAKDVVQTFTVREKPTYIAGPLLAGSSSEEAQNVGRAGRIANDLLRAGHLVYCPHRSWYQDREANGNFGWQWWILYDLEWLRRCGRLVRIPGESLGADIEVAEALGMGPGMRVYFWDNPGHREWLLKMFTPDGVGIPEAIEQTVPAEPGDILAAGSGSPR